MKTMLAFHGDPAVQHKYITRVQKHHDMDQIIHGVYWEDGKGCAVGCTIHSGNHAAYEKQLGIPTAIAYLEDRLFESMTNGRAKEWPLQFLTAVPLGADLSNVIPKFLAWLMVDPKWGVEHTTDDQEVKELCREVARRYLAGETTGPEADALAERLRAARAARAAWDARAARAAWAAWDAWDARAAWDAWDARAAWDAWDARDAWDAFVEASADELLRLLQNAPVPVTQENAA